MEHDSGADALMSLSQSPGLHQDPSGSEHHPDNLLPVTPLPDGPSPSSSLEGSLDLNEECQRLIDQLQDYIPAEAIELLYEAGFESLHAVRTLTVNDLNDAETYTKKVLKPGHKKLIMQYVQSRPYDENGDDLTNRHLMYTFEGSPMGKRRRMVEETSPQPTLSLPALQSFLERHLAESPVTRHIRKDIDYQISVQQTPDRRSVEGVWKCLVCNSRPVTISLRNGGRQPQLSNVGTHLKTIKHNAAVKERKTKTQLLVGSSDQMAVALAAMQKHLQQQQQQEQEQVKSVFHMVQPSRLQNHIQSGPDSTHLTSVSNGPLLMTGHHSAVAHSQDAPIGERQQQ
ncbi:uncharacterized protein SPPG_04478 [Spizellomyces punctatus DAOM BR117]|uniref:Uncharacterized protein n=1 Tax=Spizellomyces punctatus (strain DAOM BR117) TaxID=645134 RepID=A0A0L0HFA4_SPIPD|nr:uncharacterized protein SPPG_04478 [Spizellomyces punctatus DAOM BR117]KND00136.1 hypothetical protein SPPG_04478 [Spizellomyces punctatus DAOM BR117]|eukprot:XP_016608175.1 hypothetical protein SPPG_04478 [Spizellomyces punctatus DAOM BR117]